MKNRYLLIGADLSTAEKRDYLGELVKDGFIIAEGSNRNRIYRLKK